MGQRDESDDVDAEKAIEDAQKLYNAGKSNIWKCWTNFNIFNEGEGRMGTDESEFISIFATRSYAHIRRVNIEYEELQKHSLKKAIESEFSGPVQEALMAICKS
jgi:annexin A7/11